MTKEIKPVSRHAHQRASNEHVHGRNLSRRNLLFAGSSLATISALGAIASSERSQAQTQSAPATGRKPNILVIMGDDIGQTNISAYTLGVMGYRTPNIDRIAKEGMIFTDYYAEQSCTAGAHHSSPVRPRCERAYPKSASPRLRLVCNRKTSPSPRL